MLAPSPVPNPGTLRPPPYGEVMAAVTGVLHHRPDIALRAVDDGSRWLSIMELYAPGAFVVGVPGPTTWPVMRSGSEVIDVMVSSVWGPRLAAASRLPGNIRL